jgi:alpha-glucoside transport system permease protein
MSSSVAAAIVTALAVPLALLLYVTSAEAAGLRKRRAWRSAVRASVWILPAAVVVAVVTWYPTFQALVSSFKNAQGTKFVGLANYTWAFTSDVGDIGRTLLWVLAVPAATVLLGLLIALISNNLRYQRAVRVILLIPCAISLSAGSVIWSLMYAYQPPGQAQTGLLNAITTAINGGQPTAWLLDSSHNIENFALMVVGMWSWLGFAVVLLVSGLKAVPEDILEAAKIDGASAWQTFRRVILPQMMPTVVVTWILVATWALKVFDIVYVLTGGHFGTGVLGTSVYNEFFIAQDNGKGSALAVIMLVLVLPILLVNVYRVRRVQRSLE